MTGPDLTDVKRNRDAFSNAFALVLRTGEPNSDRAGEHSKAVDAMCDAASESARDVPQLIADLERATNLADRLRHALVTLLALQDKPRSWAETELAWDLARQVAKDTAAPAQEVQR
jgi:hypothetical protein